MENFVAIALGGKTKKNKKTNKKTKKVNCYAGRTKKENSCYTEESLLKLRDIWNKKHPDKKIIARRRSDIWKRLNENLQHVCNSELCWLEQKFIDDEMSKKIREKSFVPSQPKKWKKNPNEWLNSLDISRVMKQYENDYKCFDFLGPSPIDFDTFKENNECVWDEICNFDLNKSYTKGKRKFGFIFNLDPHYKGGSHWVSMFVDLDKNFIFFMDSNGEKIPNEIKTLSNRIKKQAKTDLHKKLRFIDNAPMEHQHENTECGIYSLYTIISLLKDLKTPDQIKRKRIADEEMEEYRSIFFNE